MIGAYYLKSGIVYSGQNLDLWGWMFVYSMWVYDINVRALYLKSGIMSVRA